MWEPYNPNPCAREVGDCAVRAVSAALGISWEQAFWKLVIASYWMCDMPSSNEVIGAVLRKHNFVKKPVQNTLAQNYTFLDFAYDHPEGVYVVGTGDHVSAVIDGYVTDSWDSLDERPAYYWTREEA
jgi:hypothetical protein